MSTHDFSSGTASAGAPIAPERVTEMHYWSSEPGVASLLRAVARMPLPARLTLAEFLERSASVRTMAHVMSDGSLRIVGIGESPADS